FRNFTTAEGLSSNLIRRVVEDRAGVIWVGTRQGLDRLVGDRFENFAAVPKALIVPFGEDRDGGFFVGAQFHDEPVTFRIDKGRADIVKELSAGGMVETKEGELWFTSDRIFRVPPGSFTQPRKSDEPLDYEAFHTADGLVSGQAGGEGNNIA